MKYKKFVTVILLCIISVFCFSSCFNNEKTVKAPDIDNAFSCDAEIKLGDMDALAKITRLGKGAWDIEFTEPKTLSGVKLSFLDNDVTASYKGLSFSIPKAALPIKSSMLNLIDTVDTVIEATDTQFAQTSDGIVLEGNTEQGEYSLLFDNEGTIFSFEMPNSDLTITFSNYSVVSNNDTPENTQAETVQESETAIAETNIIIES